MVTRPMLRLDDGTSVALDLPDGLPEGVAVGSRVIVRGSRHANTIEVTAGDGQIVGAASGATSAETTSTAAVAATGTKRVAVVLVNFSNDTSQPYTPAHAAGIAFTSPDSLAAYYAAASWGQLTLTGNVCGWYTIPDASTSCDTASWAASAAGAARAAGVNLSAYDNVVYAFPAASSCAWAGLAEVPGRNSWLNGTVGMSLRVMAHELGHNFGTHNASSLTCTEAGVRVALSASSANCTTSEYGDPFSIMGGASRYEHTNVARGNLGWLQAANTRAVTNSGDYLLAPIEAYDPAAAQVLRIQRTPSTFLTLELRQPSGIFDNFAPGASAVNGVTVRIAPGYGTITRSQLVDATPGSSTGFADAPLAPGQTLADPLTGVSITTTALSAAWATVHVSFGGPGGPPPPDTTPPTQPGSLTATPTGTSGVALSWTASTDDVGAAGYRVYRGSALVATVTTPGYADGGLSAGRSYAYQVVAFDAAGNSSTAASAAATTLAGDTQPPTAPGALAATPVDSRRVSLTWAASTDNVGVVRYRVLRNATLVATVTAPAYTEGGLQASTTYSYQVIAVDAAGNASPAASAIATTRAAADTTPPTAPANLVAARPSSKKAQVRLTWTASTDNVGVAGYRAFRNGRQVATASSTSYTDTPPAKTSAASYYVVAYDAAGNVSAASNTARPESRRRSPAPVPGRAFRRLRRSGEAEVRTP